MANQSTVSVRPTVGHNTHGLRATTSVMMWGHTFTVQPNGILVAELEEHIARLELLNGRVTRYHESDFEIYKPEKEKEEKTEPSFNFGIDIGNYYGVGDLETLRQKISAMDISNIQKFAEEKLGFKWPKTTPKAVVTEKLCEAIAEKREKTKIG